MKHFLLSWYGITDLNASLGIEELGGPILSALRTGEYTDVLILAYTDPAKDSESFDAARRMSLDTITELRSRQAAIPRSEALACTDAFANSSTGHRHFEGWLQRQLDSLGLSVRVTLVRRTLAHLNDSKGIYDAVVDALGTVVDNEPGSKITFYISPGTPVMAFTWAFVAALNPEQHIGVLACPDFRKPPESIALPYDLFAKPAHPAQLPVDHGDGSFDAIFHLFGEQRLPSLFAIHQFRCHKHIFLTTTKYPSAVMKTLMASPGQWEEIVIDAFDPLTVRAAILKRAANFPPGSRLGFSLTGGTKLMFAGAIAACRRIGGAPFYFETRSNSTVFLDDYSRIPMKGVPHVDDFFKVTGYKINDSGVWTNQPQRDRRRELTRFLWKHRREVTRLYSILYCKGSEPHFNIGKGGATAALRDNGDAKVCFGKESMTATGCHDLARYLCGGWLEEFVYLLLEDSRKQGRVRDMRIGMRLQWGETIATNLEDCAQEFDVTLTDGRRLTIIECKAGAVKVDDLYRLANSMRHYGGSQAPGVLVTAHAASASLLNRVKRMMPNMKVLSGDEVPKYLVQHVLG